MHIRTVYLFVCLFVLFIHSFSYSFDLIRFIFWYIFYEQWLNGGSRKVQSENKLILSFRPVLWVSSSLNLAVIEGRWQHSRIIKDPPAASSLRKGLTSVIKCPFICNDLIKLEPVVIGDLG